MRILNGLVEIHATKSNEPQGFLESSGAIIMDIGHEVAEQCFSEAPAELLHEMFASLNTLDVVSEPHTKDDKIHVAAYLKVLIDTYVDPISFRFGRCFACSNTDHV